MEDSVGVSDFVMLSQVTEDAFIDNLTTRFKSDKIYTYIGASGNVVVSINPYKRIDLYKPSDMQKYIGSAGWLNPPHIYALADNCYRGLMQNGADQTVIITGESGAGKTEASKILLNYLVRVSGSSESADRIKNCLLESNPLLEAFGNSCTAKNYNSSRFGKYMEIQFSLGGVPLGGRVSQYLLEKSRVVKRNHGERSFHIFYFLLNGADDSTLRSLRLNRDPAAYRYLSLSEGYTVPTINDKQEYKAVIRAMKALSFSEETQQQVLSVVAAILHLGNVEFVEDPKVRDAVKIANPDVVETIATLLGCDLTTLTRALLSRSINTGVGRRLSTIACPLNMTQAPQALDALSKALYDHLFTWIVEQINSVISFKDKLTEVNTIGILDIFGFEILETNSLEQFCINYTNEKLQQVFIERTLKKEQEEYDAEGIEWHEVNYFNNKIICDLIEEKGKGIISILDDACQMSSHTHKDFLANCDKAFATNPHYESFAKTKDRSLPTDGYRIQHYAGSVTYDATAYIDRNLDVLYADAVNACQTSSMPLMQTLFPTTPASARGGRKRPETLTVKFRKAVNDLIDTLLLCEPHYIRCIKPNMEKRAGKSDVECIRHQVKYLGLLENVRVRRAGFVYRHTYDYFVHRFGLTCPSTWPRASTSDKDATRTIVGHHRIADEDVRYGKTKIFIRRPETVFELETERNKQLPYIAVTIQKHWRGFVCRSNWAERKAAIKIQLFYRKWLATRFFLQLPRVFEGVREDAPEYGRNRTWPIHQATISHGVALLKKILNTWRAEMIVTSYTPEEQQLIRQKILAYDLLHGKKPWTPTRHFESDYLEKPSNPLREKYLKAAQGLFTTYGDQQIFFSDSVIKFNKKGKGQKRAFIVTEKNLYKQDPSNYKVRKAGIPLSTVTGVSLSPYHDGFMVIHCKAPERDLVIQTSFGGFEVVSELCTVLVSCVYAVTGQMIAINAATEVVYNNSRPGPDSKLVFKSLGAHSAESDSFLRGKGSNPDVLMCKD